MLELAITLGAFLCALLFVLQHNQRRKRTLALAHQEQIQRGLRTIQYCDRLSSQSAFVLPHGMQILFVKRKLRCLRAMAEMGQPGLDDDIHRQQSLLGELQSTRELGTTYQLPSEGPLRGATLQTFFLLNQYIGKEIKTQPAYLSELLHEKREIEVAMLKGRLSDTLQKAENALLKLSAGTARAGFESVLSTLVSNQSISEQFVDFRQRAEQGLIKAKELLISIPELNDTDEDSGLSRMFSNEKKRWA